MKVKELIRRLAGADPEAEVIIPVWNGSVETYAVLDGVHAGIRYEDIETDLFGTPGETDGRLDDMEPELGIVLLGSSFRYGEGINQIIKDMEKKNIDTGRYMERLEECRRMAETPTKKRRISASFTRYCDKEEAHERADGILCELLEELGYKEVVDLYRSFDKWYS